jgi:NAD-dependent deacetylase
MRIVSSALRLAELIRERQPCVALTGAGISTESGIPDFRSPTGIWATVDPREFASLSAFRRDPERVWDFYRLRVEMLTGAQPNRAHTALAELERRGLLRAVVTQNIDLLHERAGSVDVVEVHGSIRTSSCRRCRTRYSLAEVLGLLAASDEAPRCRSCATVLKPDVIFFEEMLPADAIDRAYELAREAQLLLVIGSSLEVWPVAELPTIANAGGGVVAIVNVGPTSFDEGAVLKIERSAGDVLEEVLSALDS